MQTYTNPLPFDDGQEHTNPDPFVMRFRGQYWCYSSGHDGVNLSVSADLTKWTSLGIVHADLGRSEYWAPCVIYAGGKFWMYYSNRPAGSFDPHEEMLRVAVSDNPAGPFVFCKQFFDTFAIDAHVVRESRSGDFYMFYSTNEPTSLEGEGTGTSILVDRLVDMETLAGEPRAVVVPTLDEEIYERDRFGDGRDWYTIEGATYFTRRGSAYLTYSGNAYVGEEYFIGYAQASLDGPIADLTWHKQPSDYVYAPLVRRSEAVEGTGHNSIVRAPNLVDDWIVYHGRNADQELDPTREQRVMRIDPLYFNGQKLDTPAPSSTPRSAPEAAIFFDDFSGQSLDARWVRHAGRGEVRSGRVGDPGMLSVASDPLTLVSAQHSHAAGCGEVSFRALVSDAGARLGAVPIFFDTSNYVAILLDAATNSVEVRQVCGGIASELVRVQVPRAEWCAWQELRWTRLFDRLSVELDGLLVAELSTGFDEPACAGLIAIGTEADFSGFTLSEHADISGDCLSYLGRIVEADRLVHIRENSVGSRNRTPVSFRFAKPVEQVALSLDVEVLTAVGEASLVFEGQDELLRIDLARDSYEISHGAGQRQAPCAKGAVSGLRTSIAAKVRSRQVVLRVGRDEISIPVHSQSWLSHLTVVGAVLHGVELTALADG